MRWLLTLMITGKSLLIPFAMRWRDAQRSMSMAIKTAALLFLLIAAACATQEKKRVETAEHVSYRESWEVRAFRALDSENRGALRKHEIMNFFVANGLRSHKVLDPVVKRLNSMALNHNITFDEFSVLGHVSDLFFKSILESSLVIPQFPIFEKAFKLM